MVVTALERRLVSPDTDATRALGARLATAAEPGDVIALFGDLGAGKTQVAKGIARGLGIDATVNSPSFVLMSEYEGRLPLFHIDLYRLEGPTDAIAGGLLDERQADGVTVIEWAERLADALPGGRVEVHIDGSGDELRTITVRATDEGLRRYLDAVA
jgi:tRNA threonylcarbamoyladenosine biosynthesis protein TsaE